MDPCLTHADLLTDTGSRAGLEADLRNWRAGETVGLGAVFGNLMPCYLDNGLDQTCVPAYVGSANDYGIAA